MTGPDADLLKAICRAIYSLILGDEPTTEDRLLIAYVARYGVEVAIVPPPLDPSDPNAPAP